MIARLVGILAVAAVLALAGCKKELYSGLSEREANEMLAVLLANEIRAEKTGVGEGNFSIEVAEEDLLYALETLKQAGFPRESRQSLGQVFEKSGIMSSPFEQRVRFMYALGEEVSRTLTEIDGVITARVHIVMPEEPEMGQPVQPSSAAVFIKHSADRNLDVVAPQIRRLVSNPIEGVEDEDVTVLLMPSEQSNGAAAAMRPPPMENVMGLNVERRQAEEAWLYLQAGAGAIGGLFLLNVIFAIMLLRRRGGRNASVPANPASIETVGGE